MKESRSPRQLWNALLLKETASSLGLQSSQSPSIMECSPTNQHEKAIMVIIVAVPVNYGMLSYTLSVVFDDKWDRRSPRQLWNALLQG